MSKVYLANWIQERKSIVGSFPAHWHYQAHVLYCAERQIRIWRRHKAWVDKWPDYCDKCDAWGAHHVTENQSPIGSGQVWLMDTHDDCGQCLGTHEMVCPRCGEEIYTAILNRDRVDEAADDGDIIQEWYEKEKSCPLCGWEWGNNPEDTVPVIMEDPCGCDLYGDRPGKWQRWVFERFGERFQGLFVYPIRIMIRKEDRNE